jgi:glycosyltransferase involved in cell wall biosynthesis
LGVVILEAFAVGKPVVASDIEGIPEIVTNGQNGFLVPPKDSNKLADCIISLLQNPDLAKKMGENGRRLVEMKFDIDQKIKEYESVYTNCAQRHL